MATFEVKDSVLEETVDFGDGNMDKYALALKSSDTGQEFSGVACWKKSRYPGPLSGETWTGEVENNPRGGLKFKNGRKVEQGSSGSASAASGGSGRDATGRSIERQVALKAAAEIVAAVAAQQGKVPQASTVVELADGIDAGLFGEPVAATTKPNDDIPF